jgi:hypothetical protein
MTLARPLAAAGGVVALAAERATPAQRQTRMLQKQEAGEAVAKQQAEVAPTPQVQAAEARAVRAQGAGAADAEGQGGAVADDLLAEAVAAGPA